MRNLLVWRKGRADFTGSFLSLRFGHAEVFELILDRKLYSALLENLISLFELDTQVD